MKVRRPLALLCAPLLAFGMSACASTTASNSFKGEQHTVAQVITNLQSDVVASDAKKICANDLASTVVSSLGTVKGCEAAIKNQLTEVDTPEVEIQSIQLNGTSASARVRSTYAGKKQISTILLVKENGKWKISKLG
jgi:copper chaperone CopZ